MKCCVCGVREGVARLRVSEKFVSYPDLFSGGLICTVCSRLFEDRKLRSSNWILIDGEFRILDKSDLLEILWRPPEGSIIYVRSSGRKYGFLKCMKYHSTKTYVALCGEDEGLVIVDRVRLGEVLSTAVEAYSVLKRKTSLANGCNAIEWVHEDVCRVIEELRGDPVWQIVVRVL